MNKTWYIVKVLEGFSTIKQYTETNIVLAEMIAEAVREMGYDVTIREVCLAA
jgi:copper chaperone CopZ|tara:strand:- start:744 stop:899 length:156 start_codon:yes stop_codon:yes gene_type:complete